MEPPSLVCLVQHFAIVIVTAAAPALVAAGLVVVPVVAVTGLDGVVVVVQNQK